MSEELTIKSLRKMLAEKKCPKFMIFCGPEQFVASHYIKMISKLLGVLPTRPETVQSIYSSLSSESLFSSTSLYVVKNDSKLSSQEKIWSSLPKGTGKNTLILLYENLDKRSKFYQANKQHILEFNRFTLTQLKPIVQNELALNDANAAKLCEMCEYDYGRVMLELDKLVQLHKAYGNMSPDAVFDDAVRGGLIYVPPKDVLFDFVSTVLTNDAESSFQLMEQLRQTKTSEILVLSLLYSNFRNVLMVQSCKGNEEKTGLSSGQAYNARQYIDYFSVNELVENLKSIRRVETGIKNGRIEADKALEHCLARILRR